MNDNLLLTHARRGPGRPVDASRPQAFFVERERTDSGEVISVATVFLTNRECPWRCVYCDLWKNTLTETVPPGAIPAQIDYALAQLWRDEFHESPSDQNRTRGDQVGTRGTRPSNRARQIKLYNAGSFFDPKAIPPEDFGVIAERVRGFERVIVECHPALVGESALRFRDLLSASGGQSSKPPVLEVAMGLEIADDKILAKLNKGMTLAMFARAAKFLREHDIAVRAFVMVKPPFVNTEAQALQFALRSIDCAFDCGATVVSLIPARFSTSDEGSAGRAATRASQREASHLARLESLIASGDFTQPKLATLEAALDYGVALRRGRVFADLWDLEKFSNCSHCFPARRQRLERANLEQAIEPSVACVECPCAPGVSPGSALSPAGAERLLTAAARQDAAATL